MESKLQELATHFVDSLRSLVQAAVNEALAEIPKPEPKPEPEPDTVDTKATQLFVADFQDVPLTGVEKGEQFRRAFNGKGNIQKVGDWWFERVNGKIRLRTRIKKGQVGSDTTGINGWSSCSDNVSVGHRELFLRYVFIPRGPRKWGEGSKLPGPVVGRFGTSGGDTMAQDGGSARIMIKDDGWMFPYIYAHGKNGTWGSDMGAGRISQVVFDQENVIDIRVVMNTASNPDGVMQIWHNGKLVCTLKNIVWQLEKNVDKGWHGIAVCSFNGGKGKVFEMEEEAGIDFVEFRGAKGDNPNAVYAKERRVKLPWGEIGGK